MNGLTTQRKAIGIVRLRRARSKPAAKRSTNAPISGRSGVACSRRSRGATRFRGKRSRRCWRRCQTSLDIWILELGTGRSEPWLQTSFNESAGVFSPDGNWLAYVSDEAGEDEVYLRGFPSHDGKTAVSSGGGHEPVWSADGSELYYRAQEWVMAVTVSTTPTLALGTPRRLFEAPFDEAGAPYANYDVARDGDGFIMIRSDEEVSASTLVVVLNWLEELHRVVPSTH